MIVRLRLHPFESQRERAARLPYIALVGVALLVLRLWNPVTTPGPVMCASRLAFAMPCPLCGATRGVALCLRGEVGQGSTFNPLALPVVLLGVGFMGLWSYEYVSGREVEFLIRRPWRMVGLVAAHGAVLAAWVYLLCFRWEDDFAQSWLGWLLGRAG